MGTFAAGIVLNRHTLRPVVGQVLQVRDFTTAALLTPDGGQLTTGAAGGYGRFVVPGVDLVTLVAPDGTLVDLVSVEAQEAAAAAGPFLAEAETRLTELESHGGTSGTGIRNVSGTVNLDDVAGIREVYATAAATVEGVALAAGDAAVFRYLAGAWTYMVVGQHTTWQAISATPVTANVPTANDSTNTITWTPKTGVQYVIGGTVRTPPYSVGDITATVVVTAQATSGYTLTGTSSWSFNFTGSAPADTTPPSPGTLAVTGTGVAGSTRTLTATGASDETALHAQPYRFSTNGGTTWSTYQSSNVFTTGALSAGTYQPRVMVRDAAGNTATASAADFTVAGSGPSWNAYQSEVDADSPVVWFPFDGEATETQPVNYGSASVTVSPNTGGYPVTAATIGSGDARSFFGRGFYFPSPIASGAALTVEALAICPTYVNEGRTIASQANGDGTTGPSWLLRRAGSNVGGVQGPWEFVVWAGGTAVLASAAIAPTEGRDYHLAATWDGTTARLYVDGTEAASAAAPGAMTWGNRTVVGARYATGAAAPFNQAADEVAIYAAALSAARIAAHAAAVLS